MKRLPWANASWTSPPTPAKESWGPWVGTWPPCVGVGPDEGERMGICIEWGEAWLGEEPAAWAWRERMKTSYCTRYTCLTVLLALKTVNAYSHQKRILCTKLKPNWNKRGWVNNKAHGKERISIFYGKLKS